MDIIFFFVLLNLYFHRGILRNFFFKFINDKFEIFVKFINIIVKVISKETVYF